MAELERRDDLLAGLAAPDERARIAAVRACARAREGSALDVLRKLAGEDPSVEVRYQARVALSIIREALQGSGVRARAQLPAAPEAGDLRNLLVAADPIERVWALREAVLHEDAAELVPDVLARVGRENEPDVRAQLVTTLAEMGGLEMGDHVARFMKDPDARVRANAVEAAETLGDPRLHPLVVKALQDSDHRVKLNAVTALDRAGKLSLIKCAAHMMRDRDYWVRDAATYSLAAARSPQAVPYLARALLDPHEPVRNKARDGLLALIEAGVEAARGALERPGAAAMDAAEPVKGTAAVDEGHIPTIVDRLQQETDPRGIVRLLTVLGSIGNAVVATIVVEYLNHPSLEVSRLAEVVLQRLGAEHLIPKASVDAPRGSGPVAVRGSGTVPVPGVARDDRTVPAPPRRKGPRREGIPAMASGEVEAPGTPVVPTFHPGPGSLRPTPSMLAPLCLLAALIAAVYVILK